MSPAWNRRGAPLESRIPQIGTEGVSLPVKAERFGSDPLISVLHFSNASIRAGAEEHILTLLRGLDRRRFRLHLVCTPQVADLLGGDVPSDVTVIPLRLQKLTHVDAALSFARVLRESQVDILHSHLFRASLLSSPIARLCGIPGIIETPHCREEWRRGWLKSRFFVDRFVGRFVDRYIAVSEANRRYLIEEKGLPAEKIVVIHNGSDLGRFDPSARPPAGLRSSLGLDKDDPVLLVLARLEPQKGHGVLLDAMPAILREFPRARLICVGEGLLRPALEEQAARLGLSESVRFVGYRANVGDWLALADLTVLPSFYEGLPLVAIESLAAGKPVVATAVDGTPEVVVDGETGLTVPPGDARALARAICHLLGDANARCRLGSAGRRWAEKEFSARVQITSTENLYQQVRLPRPADGITARPSLAEVRRSGPRREGHP
jgi:glycosyltransferase involved in cell wall biosynthesis